MAKIVSYLEINGKKFYGLETFIASSYRNSSFQSDSQWLFVDMNTEERLRSLYGATSTFVPNHGDEIYVAPNCAVPLNDIRRNYKVKRDFDTGACNVVSEENFSFCNNAFSYVIISPSTKQMFCADAYRDSEALCNTLMLRTNPSLKNANDLIRLGYTNFRHRRYCDFDAALLDGRVTKPVVSHKQLEIRSENKLDFSVLQLMYEIGQKEYSRENLKNFKIQLEALNQYNWREYPGTMDMIFRIQFHSDARILKHMQHCYELLNFENEIPRSAKLMVKESRSKIHNYASDEDYALSREFIEHYIGKIPKFTTIEKLACKFAEHHIDFQCFYRVWGNMVKVEEKRFENEKEDTVQTN